MRQFLCTFLVLFLSWSSAGLAKARIALLVGNQHYAPAVGALKNPHNDVERVGAALREIGFDVNIVKEAGFAQFNRALNVYIRRLNAAGPNAIGFFYFSGHGAQQKETGTNYLIPIDVQNIDHELWDASIRQKNVTDALKDQATNATHFVVFDACRNSLRLAESGSKALVQAKGFEPVRVVPGMLIAYATAEGEVASDIGDGVGAYAKILSEELIRPDVEAVTMFRSVQLRVREAIKQEPWLSYGALNPVWFAGRKESLLTNPSGATTPQSQFSEAAEAWDRTKETTNISVIEAFIARYRDTFFAELAKSRIEELSAKNREQMVRQEAASPPVPPSQRP